MDAAHQIISPSKLPKTTPILLAALAGLIWVLWQRYRAPKLIPQVAVVGGNSKKAIEHTRKQWKYHCMDLLVSGYLENRGQLYYAPSDRGERLMIPGRYLEELKAAPVEEVDFISTFIMMFDGKYTHVGSRDLMPPRVVRTLLNQNLPQVMPGVQDVVRDAFEARMPPCDDWTEVPMVDMINYVVARASSHMFGGYELSTNEKWLYTTLKFAEDVFYGSQKIKAFPELLKPAISPFVREIKAIKEHYRFAQELIQPILDRRRQTAAENNDLLHWLDSESEDHHKQSWFLSDIMLKLSFAALHTSASASVQLVFDLCAHPEYTPLLQREYSPFVDAEGRLDKVSLAKMPLMDSILRESMRINPLLLVTFERVITQGWTLSDGTHIPKGTIIGFPAHAVGMDPQLYPNPKQFDGARFVKKREDPENAHQQGKLQFVACNMEHMTFGYGRHACPGRFFASDEIKAIVVYLLENYEMKFPKGQTRPAGIKFETENIPDPSVKVMFKRKC